jgi:hypothetical protein
MSKNKFFKLTCGYCYDLKFGVGFIAKRKNDEDPELTSDKKNSTLWDGFQEEGSVDDYSDWVMTDSAWAFIHEEEISEDEFNNSDSWVKPSADEIAALSQEY